MIKRFIISLGAALAVVCTSASLIAAAASGWPPLSAARFDGRSPDTKDAALAAHRSNPVRTATTATPTRSFDGGSPDTKDAAQAANLPTTTTIVVAAGFDWTDAGIGALAGFGLAVVLAAGYGLVHRPTGVAIPS